MKGLKATPNSRNDTFLKFRGKTYGSHLFFAELLSKGAQIFSVQGLYKLSAAGIARVPPNLQDLERLLANVRKLHVVASNSLDFRLLHAKSSRYELPVSGYLRRKLIQFLESRWFLAALGSLDGYFEIKETKVNVCNRTGRSIVIIIGYTAHVISSGEQSEWVSFAASVQPIPAHSILTWSTQ